MIRLTGRGIGHTLRRLRHDAGMTPEGLAHRLSMSRSGVLRREQIGYLPAAALIQHAQALGCTVALIPPPRPGVRPTGTGWPAERLAPVVDLNSRRTA